MGGGIHEYQLSVLKILTVFQLSVLKDVEVKTQIAS